MVPIEYTMAVKSGDTDLKRKINDGLQQLRISGEYEKIYDKWINEDKYVINKLIERIFYVAAVILAIIAIVFVFNLRLNILLKRQVNEKTKELKKINEDLEEQIIETRNNNELRNRIVEHSPSGIIVFDRKCRITLFNHSAGKLIGIDELPVGKSVFGFELLKNILNDKKDTMFFKNSQYISEEIILKNESGETVTYRYDIYQLYDFNDNVRGAILTIEDITEEKNIREQIYDKEKNKALNQIIAGIAHEIRNPLSSIKTFIELIPVKVNNLQFQSQLVEFVPKEVERISSLIKNLIDYAKPENNCKEVIVLEDIIKSCAVLVKHTLEHEKITLNIEVEDGLRIEADKNQLKQILLNIILNGLEAMKDKIKGSDEHKEKLSMHVKAWKSEESVFIQVVDEGNGMTAEEIKKSTDPFFTTKSSGTGLGLYISKQYVERNGGTITIESEKLRYTKITLKFEG